MPEQPRVLLLSSNETERDTLQEILSKHAVVTCVWHLSELEGCLNHDSYDVLICSWSFPEGKWDKVLEQVQQLNPDLPTVIYARTGGEKEWLEVLQAGAFDLLVPPYLEKLFLSVVEQATASYRKRVLARKMEQVAS